ncbi:DEAD/DEAH box helicase [Pendulispora albinea]|uniref:DEAD/DEAH box helicase n=1 Tax=Pendulispora albinea TaxID=2741071 RepID=A0ABZ2M3B6_9BACT
MREAFDALHTNVQRKLWDMRWTELRPIQVQAIRHLLGKGGDCILSSPTASGKTEAAFLPILSAIADDPAGSVRAVYIGPLKALIDDQFRRLEELCERLEVPVHRWHGDVGDGARRRLLAAPGGVLLITPESLEAMFVRRATAMPRLFRRLAYVVVDEMHAFLGTERGAQLVCQLHRLRMRAGCDPVRIGLSATLGDAPSARGWLRPGGPAATLIEDSASETTLAIRVRGLWRRAPRAGGEREDAIEVDTSLVELARAILLAGKGNTNLIFANAKSRIEALADALVREAESMQLADAIVVHHGSLSKEMRAHAEERLRAAGPCSAVCSNTLELGIDIGQIDEVVQVSAPWSVASLVQRVGRSGRRAHARRVLRGYFVEDAADAQSVVWDGLHLEFLRAVALIELMLERFLEPPHLGRAHASTLIHQILSTLAETGGATAAVLYARVVGSGAFAAATPESFAEVLRELGRRDLIEQMGDGSLVLGDRGQDQVDHYTFYAAFHAPEELRVLHGDDVLGTLAEVPPPGEHVIFAGRRWRVDAIDMERRAVFVSPSKGGKPPAFISPPGLVHPEVHRKMRELLLGGNEPAYLDDVAKAILKSSRATAARVGYFAPSAQPFAGGLRLFLFGGTRVHKTLYLVLARAGIDVDVYDIGLEARGATENIVDTLRAFANAPDPEGLAAFADEKLEQRRFGREKFEPFLPPSLWRAVFVREELDIPSVVVMVQGITS